jgi:hypothetical protein
MGILHHVHFLHLYHLLCIKRFKNEIRFISILSKPSLIFGMAFFMSFAQYSSSTNSIFPKYNLPS